MKKKDGATATELLRQPGSTLVNSRDLASGQTALHIAAQRRDATWLNFLLGKKANPNIADKKGMTPLMIATQLGFAEGVQLLASGGARVDEANSAGETPLIFAVHGRNLSLVRILLAAGANPDRTDSSGRSARDYALLDGAGNPVVGVIERHDESGAASGKTYGPKL